MQTIINILVFIVVLGSIITIHELGHFIAAKAFGVFCSEFSLGMGPSLWHKKKGETTYHIRALPIGGYVAMAGEVDQEENEIMKDVPFERTIKGIKTWKQVVVMSAGVFMNFVLAFVLLFTITLAKGQLSVNNNVIGNVLDDGAAVEIGILEGDAIVDVYFNSTDTHYSIETMADLSSALSPKNNGIHTDQTEATITYIRDGQTHTANGILNYNSEREAFYLGVQVATRNMTVVESIQYSLDEIKEMSMMIFTTLGKLVTDSKNTISQLSGPAGIYQVTSEVTESGQYTTLVVLIAALSVNVGIFNLLPIPGLDGSQILFSLLEKAMGHPISTNVRYYLQVAGMLLVFGLMIIVTIQDISRMF